MIAPPPLPEASGDPSPAAPAPLPTQTAALGETISFETGVAITIDEVSATTVTASTPGEVSGPAVVVRVTAQNDSTTAHSVDSAVVSLVADDGALGIPTTAGPVSPLAGDVSAGASREGTYVFMLDPATGRAFTVTVNYAAGEPVAVFQGSIS
jgi:hypothetical protein